MPRDVEAVALPERSLIAAMPFHDYADAFRIRVDEEACPDIDALARAFGSRTPAWIRALMWIRDGFAGLAGLKRSTDAPASGPNDPLAIGKFIGFFRIVARDENEIVAGEDDRHLDFRVSLLRGRDGAGAFVTVSTVVRFNSALGRAYFVPVGPFHRRVVPAMMRAASRSLTPRRRA